MNKIKGIPINVNPEETEPNWMVAQEEEHHEREGGGVDIMRLLCLETKD